MTAPHPRLRIQEHDSPLGRWRISLWQPDARLAGIVAAMWLGEGRVNYRRDRILPSVQSQLLINLGPVQYRIAGDPLQRRVPFVDAWYAGLHQTPIDTEAPHGNALLGIAFTARGGHAWLGGEVAGLADSITPLTDLCGDGAGSLRQRLLNLGTPAERFAHVERWLLARVAAPEAVHPAVAWCLDQLAHTQGRVRIETLASRTGFSRRYLARLFQQQVGLGPKQLARVHRFRQSFELLRGCSGRVPWAALAQAGGFYDQSHLVNEIRAFTGFTPVELARRDRPDAHSIVLG